MTDIEDLEDALEIAKNNLQQSLIITECMQDDVDDIESKIYKIQFGEEGEINEER